LESRLNELAGDPEVPLSEAVGELRVARQLRPRLAQLRGLRSALDEKAHELRSAWIANRSVCSEPTQPTRVSLAGSRL
jgi:hypothetical protein